MKDNTTEFINQLKAQGLEKSLEKQLDNKANDLHDNNIIKHLLLVLKEMPEKEGFKECNIKYYCEKCKALTLRDCFCPMEFNGI